MRLRACLLAIAALVPARAFAQTPAPAAAPVAPRAETAAPAVAATPAPAAVPAPGAPPPTPVATPAPSSLTPTFTFGGLVDAYYLFNFIRADGANTLAPPVGRAFDTNANSMTLALAKLSMNAALDPVALQLDLGYGSVGTIINNSGAASPSTGSSFLVEQAFGTISLPGNLSLDVGKFVTSAGAEVIDANKNWLYSRSFLFNAIPLLHTGVRVNLKVNELVSLQASLVNGWNNDPDNNAWKTIGLMATMTPTEMLSLTLDTYFGKESAQGAASSTPGDLRLLVDFVAGVTLSEKLGLNLNVDYIKAPSLDPTMADDGSDYQVGAALMGRYIVNDHLYIAARGEFLSTHSAMAAQTTTVEEGTLMAGLSVGKNFQLRPELRADFSGDDVYAPDAAGMPTKKNQLTGEIAALTWF